MLDTYRIDRGGLLRSPRRNDQGFLLVDGYATRIGILEYADESMPDGIRRELRLPEDLFVAESLASYEGVIVTDGHPATMIDKHCAADYARGTVLGAGRRDGDFVAVSLVVHDAGLINRIETGAACELSPGYRIRYDATPGVDPTYGAYHGRQRDVRVNHQAVVPVGRSGPNARLRMDGADVPIALNALDTSLSSGAGESRPQPVRADTAIPSTGERMPDTNDKTPDLAAQLAAAVKLAEQEKVRADAAEVRANKAEGSASALTAELAAARAERVDAAAKDRQIAEQTSRADAAEKAKTEALTRLDVAERALTAEREGRAAAVKARLDIERSAAPILAAAATDGKAPRLDDKTDRQVMELVITTRGGKVEADRNDDFVGGAFKTAVENWQAGEGALDKLRGDQTVPAGGGGGRSTRADGLSGRALMLARLKGQVKD